MIDNIYRNILLVTVFLAAISFPILNGNLKLVKDIDSTENRQLASKPEFDITHLDRYPVKYEKYFDDHFSLRSLFIKYFNELNIKIFQKSPIPDKVVIGKDKWLFMAEKELASYQGFNRFTDAELEAFRTELEYRREYLAERGCAFYFMVAPIKANIYPEFMPSTIFRVNDQSWGEQLIEYLNETSSVKPVNVYEVLREKRKDDLVYFKLDNHWNQLGAFYSAREFFLRLQEEFPGIEVPSIEEYQINKADFRRGNIIDMLANSSGYNDINFQLEPVHGFQAKDVNPAGYPVLKGFPYPDEYEKVREIQNSNLPRILIITDSYGKYIFPFLSEKFSRSVKIFDSWQYKLNEEIVNSEKPDVVLLISLEAYMRSILENGVTRQN